nr:STAS/SEC14 domain-containing protein [Epilithonimonas vandammei]
MPEVAKFTEKYQYLNYMLIVDTILSNFSAGTWLNDMVLGLQELKNWHRAAIVIDNDAVDAATKVFNTITIGEFKVFKHQELTEPSHGLLNQKLENNGTSTITKTEPSRKRRYQKN